MAVHGRYRGRVALEVEDAAEHVVVVAAAVVAGDAAERPVQHAVDVAVGRVNGRQHALRHGSHQLVEIPSAARQRTQLHDLVEDAVSAVHLFEE